MSSVQYLVFDVESAADGSLISKVRYPADDMDPAAAIRAYRDELIERNGSDFIPYTYQIPVAVVAAKVGENFDLLDIVALDEPEFRPHVITENFWRGWEAYRRPTLVTFNGRGFDVPLLELAAFRYGLGISGWIDAKGPNYQQPRYRYNVEAHLDLCDVLTNFGAARLSGGLNLTASMLGKPGKMDIQGDMVQDMFDEGQGQKIADYCRCDVLDTYFVFLRVAVLMGRLTLEREQEVITATKDWLADRADQHEAYRLYLDNWGDWHNPWQSDGEESA